MERLIRDERIWRAVAIASITVGAAAVAGVILFILLLSYAPMAICIALAAHGFYASPFYLIRYSNLKRTRLIIEALNGGCDVASAALAASVSEQYAAQLLERARQKGYVV